VRGILVPIDGAPSFVELGDPDDGEAWLNAMSEVLDGWAELSVTLSLGLAVAMNEEAPEVGGEFNTRAAQVFERANIVVPVVGPAILIGYGKDGVSDISTAAGRLMDLGLWPGKDA
jgi:hypothetical protein